MILRLLFSIMVLGPIGWASDIKADLHSYFEKACNTKGFIGVASLTVNGETVFSDACGWADAEWRIANTAETRFRTGSIGKQFTAASVLLLHAEGKVSLSDPIRKCLPNLPQTWRSATIHQLLTHTSGVPIFDYSDATLERRFPVGPTPAEVIHVLRHEPLLYPHGTKMTYNNTGYFLLGFLIEKLSGMKYDQFVQQRILDRVGMRDSGFDDMHKIVIHRARGYALVHGDLENADPIDAGASAWSAGAFYSTLRDLTLWSEALAHGKVLNADSTARMFSIYPETERQGAHYGYAVVLANRFGHALQYHGGGIKGFNSVLQRYPEANVVIVVFSNLDSDSSTESMMSWSLGDGLAQTWFDSKQ